MEELICNECKGRKFRKISASEYECEYCGAVIKEAVEQAAPKVVIVRQQNQAPQPQAIVTPFPPEVSFGANCKDGTVWLGGKLFITPDKFIFKPHSFNFSGGNLSPREWRIVDIVGYVKGLLTYLDIKMRDGGKVKLAVNGKNNIINVLEDRRKYWLEKN